MLRTLSILIYLILISVGGLLLFGPRAPIDGPIAIEESAIAADPAGWLAAKEAVVADLRLGAEARVVWANAGEAETEFAVVYIHGFSATTEEIRPVPDRVAGALGANLVFARLTGHGRDGDAMAEAAVPAWRQDVAEALAVGRAVGRRVIVMGTSTGGSLAAIAAFDQRVNADIAGLVLISPNFKLNDFAGAVLDFPFARHLVPAIVGPERSFAPQSEAHAAWWTTSYPSTALVPVGATVRAANALPFFRSETPVLFAYSPDDLVVDAGRTAAVAEAWGGPVTVHEVGIGPGIDPFAHVIAGDILSPEGTEPMIEAILAWAETL
ncbi:MAG: alpha/beta fold hydrolase [Pseudomonadota bacterium]